MSDVEIEPVMTNEELQTAILHTHTLTRTTCRDASSYRPLCDHLANLLKIQESRAAIVTATGADHA